MSEQHISNSEHICFGHFFDMFWDFRDMEYGVVVEEGPEFGLSSNLLGLGKFAEVASTSVRYDYFHITGVSGCNFDQCCWYIPEGVCEYFCGFIWVFWMSPGKKLCQEVKFWREWGLMWGYNILHQGDLVETCEGSVGSMHIAYESQDQWFGDEISTQCSKFGTAPRAVLEGTNVGIQRIAILYRQMFANKKLLNAVVKMKDSKLHPGIYVVQKIIGEARGKAGQGSRQGRWYIIWGGGAAVHRQRGGQQVSKRGGRKRGSDQGRRSNERERRSSGRVCPSNKWGHSERVQRSNEWVGRAMGGGSGGTATRGSEIVGGEVDVAIGNGAGPGKGRGPKGRLANDMPDLMYRDRSGWIGVIMGRFEDQRNPGAAGRFYARYGSRNAPQCNGKYSIIERIQSQICDEGAREVQHPPILTTTTRDPTNQLPHLRTFAGGVHGEEYRHPTRCARINAPDDAAVGGWVADQLQIRQHVGARI
ncbi:hypothetical protein DFH08DRAFT_824000 [Mycena albidolilacea]|uniref:Uncharacterized protein n=1 Tax=Mycena albidolilacea TaxID=1033008 RepID=A0AAD6Z633_9AGAR|nr:hypothetical protein DFH08DRAFT_824000 [Mycena albidolilacea]